MGVYTKLIKKIAAVTAATVVSAAVLPLWQVSVPVWAGQEVIQEDREASELTLESVRSEAAASYSGRDSIWSLPAIRLQGLPDWIIPRIRRTENICRCFRI